MQILKKNNNFSEKLLCGVQALDAMGKIKKMNGYVRVTLVKLQLKWWHLGGLEISAISRGLREKDCKKSYTTEW